MAAQRTSSGRSALPPRWGPTRLLRGGSFPATATPSVLQWNGSSTNIFWQIGTSATLGTDSVFAGTIIADQSITLNTRATLDGRALALNGAVRRAGNRVGGGARPLGRG